MKVKYININKSEPNLSENKIYYVIAVEFSNLDLLSGDYIKYRIMNDMNQVRPYSAKNFDVVSGNLSKSWRYHARSANDYSILPSELAYAQFWEDFYNDDKKALELFEGAYMRILTEEASAEEIKEILHTNEYEFSLILKGLGINQNDDYLQDILEVVKKELTLFKVYSGVKVKPILIECFEYLSKIGGEKIDGFFAKYYEDIEGQCKKLDMIVNEYFSKK